MTRAELTRAEHISAPPLTAPTPARRRSRLLGSPKGELAFSILTGEHKGRQVKIRGAKCTIGSGRGCTLRLRASGVKPVHCWILRGAGGTIVRRRHRDTQLNGCTFEDAVLSPGDRLRIGSVEIEVSSCPLWTAGWSAETAQPTPIYDEHDRELWERAARESSESIDRLRCEMQDLERRATSQLSELNGLVGRVSSERDSLQEQLRRTESDAVRERDSLLLDKQRLEVALATGEQELAELRTHLTTREVEIESVLLTESRRVAEIQNKLEEVLRERTNLEARLHDQTASLRDQCTARQAERDSLQDECQRLDAELGQLRELVGYTAAQRDQLTLNVDGAQRLLSEQHDQLQRENRELLSRLETTQTRLVEAERRLAVVQVEGDSHLHGEMERVGLLQQRLDRTEFEKSELETELRESSAAWQAEQLRLSEQHGRLSEQCVQLEGQLKHLRELVESLAAEKDSLCEQLEAADLRLTAEQETFQQERAGFAQKLADQEGSLTTAQQRCEQLEAQLNERLYGTDEQAAVWKQQADEYEEQIRALCEQLATTTGRLAELQTSGEANREIESVLATKRQLQLEHAQEELATLQAKLAEAETRLASAPVQSPSPGLEQHSEWERRAGELQVQLTAAELKVASAEDRLAAVQAEQTHRESEESARAEQAIQRVAELEQQAAAASQWKQRAAENETSRSALEAQLAELTDAIRFERDSWQHDRDRMHQECRMLGQRLIQKQKEYDSLEDQFKTLAKSQGDQPVVAAQNTITMDQIRDEVAAAAELDEERAAWTAERDRLRQTIDELESQLASRPEFAQQMTMGPDAIAQLQAQSHAAQQSHASAERIAELELALESARCELDESRAWKERLAALAAELEERQAQNHQLRMELETLQRELAVIRVAEPIAAANESPEGEQLAGLQQFHDQQAAELQAQQQSLESQRAQLASESELLAAARQELEAQQQEQQQTQAEFEARWRLWEENLRRQEELLQKQSDELAQRVAGAEATLAASATQEQAFADRAAQLQAEESRLADMRAEIERLQAEAMQSQKPAPQSGDDERVAHQSSKQAAALSSEAMVEQAYDRAAMDADEDAASEAVQDSAPAIAAPSMPEHFAPQFAPSSTPSGDMPKPVWNQPGDAAPPADDDSIEAYMSRLLKRVRGDAPGAPSFTPPAAPKPAPVTAPTAPVEMAPIQPAAAVEPVKPEEYVPRQKAPELTTNLAAMRELANSAARTAIVKHQKRSGSRQAMMQSVGALLTLVCGLVAAFGAYYFRSLPGAIAAGIGLAVALYWGGKAAIRVLGLMMLKAPSCRDDHDEPVPATAPIPAGESLCAVADACPPEPPADPTETLHPDYIAPELSQSQGPSGN